MIESIAFWAAWILAVVANSLTDWYGFSKRGDEAWKKYKKPMEAAPLNLYYKLTGLAFKEKFFLSGTILTFLVDKFHFYQFLQTALVISAFILRPDLTWSLVVWMVVIWGISTHVSYIYISKKNR